MTAANLAPPLTALDQIDRALRDDGFVVVSAQTVAQFSHVDLSSIQELAKFWEDLPRDPYLKDGGRYRFRRHASYQIKGEELTLVPHRAHWQSLDYNALHGGIERWFEPIKDELLSNAAWKSVLLGNQLNQIKPASNNAWYVEVHQFRIDTTDGIGRPTPEGAHRDGVDFVAVLMLGRHQIKGGETRVFEANGPQGQRFTLNQSFSLMVLDDERVIHESTPIQPIDPDNAAHAWRDTLVVTFRRDGFQDGPKAN